MPPTSHQFYAVAFEENFSLKDLSALYPGARVSTREIKAACGNDGEVFLYPFGAIVFHDVPPDRRIAELTKLNESRQRLTTRVVREDFVVTETPAAEIGIVNGQ